MTGIGIPVGGLLIFLSASQRTVQFSGNDPSYGNNGYYRQQNVSPLTALLGVLGAVATLYGVVNSINLLSMSLPALIHRLCWKILKLKN